VKKTESGGSTAATARELVVTRVVSASPEAVFGAWTEAERFARWFGPSGSTMPHCELDARPGGVLHFCHRLPGHEDVWVRGEYEEVERPTRLSFTCHFSDAAGGRRERAGFPSWMRIRAEFTAAGGGTRVVIRQEGLERDQGEVAGWLDAMERLWYATSARASAGSAASAAVAGGTTFVLPPDEPVLLMRRVFDAPRTRVWRAMTEPRHVQGWWGPRGTVNPECELELRPGGAWRIASRARDGTTHLFRGRYLEVEAPSRLVNTFSYEADPAGTEVVETHTLEETDAGTVYHAESRFPSFAARDATVDAGMEAGAAQSMDRMAEIVAAMAPSERELELTRRLSAPPARVYAAWTDARQLPQWWGPAGYRAETLEIEVREGGRWRFLLHGPQGEVYPSRIEWTGLEPDSRITYRHGSDLDDDPGRFDVTVTLRPEGDGTRLTMRLRLRDAASRDFVIGFGAVELGYQTLGKLERHCLQEQGSGVR
jgi:uncharacterized protein YndB with AHSA1/START domain